MKTIPIIELQNPPAGAIPATVQQLLDLGVTQEEIDSGQCRGKLDARYPWGYIVGYRAIVETSQYREEWPRNRTYAAFYPMRQLSRPTESGYHLEGRVSRAGRKRSAFTSSQLFQLPDGRLVDVATIHARGDK
jgi:hypothetical protein